MSILYRGSSKDASYQVSIHLAKRFQMRWICLNQSIRNKNCLWRPCLLTDRDEMRKLYRGPAIDTPYQVSVHLATRFQRRRLLKIGQSETELPMAAMFVNGSGQNEQSLERTFHRCFLPSFTSFGWGVSEEKIKMWKVNGRQTTDAKWWQKLTLPWWAKKFKKVQLSYLLLFYFGDTLNCH
jgi:hypothetical protein